MLVFPNAKINLGLNIIEKRSDGYHNIETVFYPVQWKDILELLPAEHKINRKSDVQFRSTGITITGGSRKNSCVQAYFLLKEKYSLPPIQMHLHKLIPAGAGLGGGSSDAAFMLKALNEQFSLGMTEAQLESTASEIGADCAFFIRNRPVFASGKGDEFATVTVDLSPYSIVIVKPDVHVNTAVAYKNIAPAKPAVALREVIKKPVEEWKELLKNDFETTVFKKQPAIRHIKEQLYEYGAVYASLTGSGSAVFGIFNDPIDIGEKFHGYLTWQQHSPQEAT